MDGQTRPNVPESLASIFKLLHPSYKEPGPSKRTYITSIDPEEEGIPGDVRLTLRSLCEDLNERLERFGLSSSRSTSARPGNIICAIVVASQFIRRMDKNSPDRKLSELLEAGLRLIIIDDRLVYLPEHTPRFSSERLTQLECAGHLVSSPAVRESAGVKASNLLREARVESLLAEALNLPPFLVG